MSYVYDRHHRNSIRMRSHNYAATATYFVTIVAQGRACLFGQCANGNVCLNDAGEMVLAALYDLPVRFSHVTLEASVVMPNHVYCILRFVVPDSTKQNTNVGVSLNVSTRTNMDLTVPASAGPTPLSLGRVLQAFKSISTVKYIQGVKQQGWEPFNGTLWQRNYHERILRTQGSVDSATRYIRDNPKMWDTDTENPFVGT